MKKQTGLLAIILISLSLTLAGVADVEARRFGAGRSFGGKSSYGKSYKRSATAKPARTASQKQAYKKNQTVRQNMSRRGGFMGMLGGLALGGLLGAMFFGGGFEAFNFMDILVFGGIAYLLFRLFAARAGNRPRTVSNSNSYDYSDNQQQPFSNTSQHSSADFDTDVLFNKDKQWGNSAEAEFEEQLIPQGFDETDFLAGAIGAFKDLQKAWDNRDLAEIRGLTTDKVFAEIQDQLTDFTETNQTDVLKIDAELLSIRELDSDLEAVVLFDTIIRENIDSQAEQMREVWHFIKSKNSLQPKWYLDGIQQLED